MCSPRSQAKSYNTNEKKEQKAPNKASQRGGIEHLEKNNCNMMILHIVVLSLGSS